MIIKCVALILLLFLVTIVSATDYCTPPGNITTIIDHNGDWFNITLLSSDCYTCVDSGAMMGDIVCTPCDNTPPNTITNLTGTPLSSCDGVVWRWIDSDSSDFSRIMVWLGDTWIGNVSHGLQQVTTSGLIANTSYNLSTLSVDSAGNVNNTFVNATAMTTGTNCTAVSSRWRILPVEGETPLPPYLVPAAIAIGIFMIVHNRRRKQY